MEMSTWRRAAADSRSKLTSAIKEAVGVVGNMRELVPRTEVEILDETMVAAVVREALSTLGRM